MGYVIALPNPFDPEGDKILLGEEFVSDEEAIEWAAEMFGADEEGKVQIVMEYEEDDEIYATENDEIF